MGRSIGFQPMVSEASSLGPSPGGPRLTWVKVCGLTRPTDVETAVASGVDAVGFVLAPESPRRVTPDLLPRLAAAVPDPVWRVAVLARLDPHTPLDGADTLQAFWPFPLPDDPSAPARRALAVLRDGSDLGTLLGLAPTEGVSAVVLDAHHPALGGGTGRLVDLGLAAELRARLSLPLVVAGGLTPENVADVIRRVRPWGVDVSSGVESAPGEKDPDRVRAFVQAAKGA